jgi:biopolymer transport protein ExbD
MISLRQSDPHDGTLRDLAPDLTPMLDILFILLVFFMITAGAVFQSLDLKLPSSVSEKFSLMNESKHIMLEIREDSYALDGQTIADFDSLKIAVPEIIKAKPEHEVIIAGDKRIAIEKLLKVLTYLQSEGIEAANILMQNENVK